MYSRLLAAGAALSAMAVSACAPTADMRAPLAVAPEVAEPTSTMVVAPEIEFTQWELENGLKVIAITDDTTANVTTSLWYEVGSKHDPQGRSGFSHLFEHILSRQTENMPYNMVNRLTEDVGGVRNASNSSDRTNYYETVPAAYLETMLWTHAERMARPVVDSVVFEKERDVVKEELRQRVLAPPYGRLTRFVIPENAYDVLPMRRPGIGSIDELDAATLDDARAFHQAYYGPDTATLIVAGNFEMENLRALVDQYFAAIPPRANPISLEITATEPERTTPRTVNATAPNVPLPVAGGVWKVPPAIHPDIAAIEVMTAIMARGDNSRFHEALVRTGKAVDAVQFINPSENGGFVANFAILSPGADETEASEALVAEVERMRTELVSDAELAEAKNELFSDSLAARQTVRGRAFELGEALVVSGDPRGADIRLSRIAAVTAEDVRRVAADYLDPQKKVTITYRAGEDNAAAYANPYPMPEFGTVPPATGEPSAVKPEGERQAPPPPGEAPQVAQSDFVETTLSNGIPLVTTQTSDVPMASITVVLPGGDADDPNGKAGLAGFAAGLADKGTANRTAQEIASALESQGASLGASSRADGTYVSLTAPTASLAAAGDILVDVIQSASYPVEELERERKRTLDNLVAAYKDPGTLASFVVTRVMYGDAPYGEVANPASISAITQDDLVAFRETYWHPAAAKIVISGGIDATAAQALAEELFGDWTSSAPAPTATVAAAGEGQPVRTVVIDMPDAGQAAVVAGVRALSRKDPDYYRLWLANTVLGSGSNGRLFEEIRTKRALSYGAYSSLGTRADTATLTASAQTKNETADEVATIFLDEFTRMGTEPLGEEDLQKRRLFLGGALARSMETSGGFNAIVAGLLLQGIDPKEATLAAQRLQEVSPDDAAAIAARYLVADEASIVIVGDAKQFIDDLRMLRPNVEVIDADRLDLSLPGLVAPDLMEGEATEGAM